MATITNIIQDEGNICKFQLAIKNFGLENGKYHSCNLLLNQSTKWTIYIYPKGSQPENKGFISIFLRCKSKVSVVLTFKCSVINRKSQPQCHKKLRNERIGYQEEHGFSKFLPTPALFSHFPRLLHKGSVLNLFCTIKLNFNQTTVPQKPSISLEPGSRQRELFADLTLTINGKSIKVHKLFLANASEEFYQILKEKPNRKTLELKDLDFEAAQRMINFIYDDKIEDIQDSAKSVLIVAEKYEMARLKAYCEKTIRETMTIENVLETLEYAVDNDCDGLTAGCVEFMARNIAEIPMADWQDFIFDFPSVFLKLFRRCVFLNYNKIFIQAKKVTAVKAKVKPPKRRIFGIRNGFFQWWKDQPIPTNKPPVKISEPSQPKPPQNFKYLYLDEKLSDVKLKIGTVFLNAHKSVLSARSQVFKAMFEHDTKESRDNQVVITSYDLPIMKELLRYIYCNRVLNVKKYALDLLPAADYYNLPELVEKCVNSLQSNMSLENLAEIYQLADLYTRPEVKEKAIDYFGKHILEHVDYGEWRKAMKKDPETFSEIFLVCIEKYFKK